MNNVQSHATEQKCPGQQGRILGRMIGREINPEEAALVTGGVQCLTGVYDRNTGRYKYSDDGAQSDA